MKKETPKIERLAHFLREYDRDRISNEKESSIGLGVEILRVLEHDHLSEDKEKEEYVIKIKEQIQKAMRTQILDSIRESEDNLKAVLDICNFCFAETEHDLQDQDQIISPITPLLLLEDLLLSLSLPRTEEVFEYLERKSSILVKPQFQVAKIQLCVLRMCKALIRRFAVGERAGIVGRIIFFVSYVLPLSERSGVNVASSFNVLSQVDSESSGVQDELDFVDDLFGEESNVAAAKLTMDYYETFWGIQKYFKDPMLLFRDGMIANFVADAGVVFEALEHSRKMLKGGKTSPDVPENGFSSQLSGIRFLSSPKLLKILLKDVFFARVILLQFLILCSYLLEKRDGNSSRRKLSTTERKQVLGVLSRTEKLMSTTFEGKKSLSFKLQKAVDGEQMWSKWKQEGCRKFEIQPLSPVKITSCETIIAKDDDKGKMGDGQLSKLWERGESLIHFSTHDSRNEGEKSTKTREPYFDKQEIERFAVPSLSDYTNLVKEEGESFLEDNVLRWRMLNMLIRSGSERIPKNYEKSSLQKAFIGPDKHKKRKKTEKSAEEVQKDSKDNQTKRRKQESDKKPKEKASEDEDE